MSNSTITIGFKLQDGADGLKTLTLNTKGLRDVLSSTTVEAKKLSTDFIKFAGFSTSMNSLSDTMNTLKGAIQGYTDAYRAQAEVETKLATVMRNTMSATDDEIESIKNLCSAQQSLGVVGDEVQLAGAQCIAGFLKQRESLEALIPAMNDLLVKQYGLSSTQENAAQIATAMGKALDGNTGALKRYGVTFTDAQEKIIKYGTETQKTAVLVDAITAKFGGMNEELGKTDIGKMQQLNNWLGDVKENIGEVAQALMPTVTLVASTTTAITGVFKLGSGIRTAGIALLGFINRQKLLSGLLRIATGNKQKAARALEIYSTAAKGSAASTRVLGMALRGLLIATGIGAAFAVLTTVIAYFCSKANDATFATQELKDVDEEYIQATSQAKLNIDNEISSLKNLIDTNKDTADAVNHLNSQYGNIFGKHETAAEWYDVLTSKSRNYVKQLGLEARAKALLPKLAEAINKKDEAEEEMQTLKNEGKDKTIVYSQVGTGTAGNSISIAKEAETKEYKAARERKEAAEATETALQAQLDATTEAAKKNSEILSGGQADYNRQLKVTEMNLEQVGDAVTDTEAKLRSTIDPNKIKDLKAYNAQLAARKKYLEKLTGLGSKSFQGRTLVKDPKTEKELSNNISIYKEKVTGEDTEEQRAILAQTKTWENMRKAIQEVYDEMERPAEIKCLEDFDKELNYLRKKRSKASGEALAELDAQIESVEEIRREYERQGHVAIPIDQIKTYRQLNNELDYYNSLLETAEGTTREAIQGTINKLNDLKNTWDEALKKKPEDISKLNTIEQLGDAITYYQHVQGRASGEEGYNIALTIAALEKKRDALNRVSDIIKSQQEIENLNNLSGKDFKVKIRSIGFEGFTDRIRELKQQLNDSENPVTDQERERIENLIETFEELRRKSIDTFEVFKSGYSNIKSIGNGVESLTEAINGNGNAWQTLTGIVDAFIQIFEGIQAIVGIVDMLTEATKHHSEAKKAETQNTLVSTAATMADTAAGVTDIAVKEGEAIAGATESGSSLPFPMNIIAIAAGVAAVVGALAMIGGFATGGIVPGNSPSGDKLLARVNSGEMILNKSQQRRLFNMLNGHTIAGPNVTLPGATSSSIRNHDWEGVFGGVRANLRPAGEAVVVGGTLRASGRDLVCVLANETRIASKSGHRTNIKI